MNAPITGTLHQGTVVADRFLVLDFVAEGGMGTIYRARHLNHNRIIALKVVREDFARAPAAVKRFKREIDIVKRLRHPSTVSVLEYGDSGGLLYLAMEWLEGQDLRACVDAEGPLPPAEVTTIAEQVLESLIEAHGLGIVHRDLKPENIFLLDRRERRVKVLDFGLAKMMDGDAETQITRIGTVCGTPEYMSPEHARGEPLDGRSDLYALGCVLYTLLTGAPPFTAENPLDVVSLHQTQAIPRLPEALPASLDALIQRATAKEPERRFESARAMLEALTSATTEPLGSRHVLPVAPSLPRSLEIDLSELEEPGPDAAPAAPSPSSPAPTVRAPMLVIGAVVVAALGVGLTLLFSPEPEPAERTRAPEGPPAVTMPAAPPEVVIEVQPAEAVIIVDDGGKARRPPLRFDNSRGLEHQLEILPTQDGYASQRFLLSLPAGEAKTILIPLMPE